MKHICFFSPGSYPYLSGQNTGTSGGAELVQSIIAKELAKKEGYQVFVIVDDYGQDNLEVHDGVFVYKCPMNNKHILIKLYNILATLWEINADIYCQRSAMAETGIIAFFCWIKKKKFLYSMAHDYEVDGTFYKKAKFYEKILYKYGIHRANQIIAQSEYQQTMLKNNSGL